MASSATGERIEAVDERGTSRSQFDARGRLPYSPTEGYHKLRAIDKAATKVYAREPILLWAARHQLVLASLNDHEN